MKFFQVTLLVVVILAITLSIGSAHRGSLSCRKHPEHCQYSDLLPAAVQSQELNQAGKLTKADICLDDCLRPGKDLNYCQIACYHTAGQD